MEDLSSITLSSAPPPLHAFNNSGWSLRNQARMLSFSSYASLTIASNS